MVRFRFSMDVIYCDISMAACSLLRSPLDALAMAAVGRTPTDEIDSKFVVPERSLSDPF